MIHMNDETLNSPETIRPLLEATGNLKLSVPRAQRYEWLAGKLRAAHYSGLSRKDKSVVRKYLQRVTGYSRAQLTRLIRKYRSSGRIERKPTLRHRFPRRYTREDVVLIAKTDEMHQTPSGAVTKKLLERAYKQGNPAYAKLQGISVSHIYNLRRSATYRCRRRVFEKTRAQSVCIGERRKPQPNGCPGYLRIDTVHQGDQDNQKGVYHINAVDEVTQFTAIRSVEKISKKLLIPVLAELLDAFPFPILELHSDCGLEYVNRGVKALLDGLCIDLTKSRARHCNDNALVECKNGAVIRKCFGYGHIPQKWAVALNQFNRAHVTPYVNFHRPCYFARTITDVRGKERKTYPYELMMTPHEKLKSLPNAEQFLKPGITLADLDRQAIARTDLESATLLRKARKELFRKIWPGIGPEG
jgi:hypothetical protein